VVFDVLFSEPSIYGAGDDQALADAMRRAPAFVAPLCAGRTTGEADRWPDEVSWQPPDLRHVPSPLREELLAHSLPRCAFPVPEVAAAATLLGNAMDEADDDGIFRRATLFHVFDERFVPSLGLAAFLADRVNPADRPQPLADPLAWQPKWLTVAGRRVPRDAANRIILRFRGPADRYETINAAAVIQSQLRVLAGEAPSVGDPHLFKDCYVFFGFSAPGLLDSRPTPVSKDFPGVAVHATLLDNLMSEDFLRELPAPVGAAGVLMFSVLSATSILLCRKIWQTGAVGALLLPLPIFAGFTAYAVGWWWPLVAHQCAVVLGLGGAMGARYVTEGRQKAFIKRAFRHYLSPAVIERIIEDPSSLQLGGERRELTIFFSDLHGFSALAERLDPQALTAILNDYLTDMTEIILEEGGTLDKYVGDAIIAFWSAPWHQPDHALRACRAAVRCQGQLAARRGEFRARSGADLRMRIGINSGEVVVGNMGSQRRFDYTVLGDAANLASRLEGANKAFGTIILMSDATRTLAGEQVDAREIGLVRVVGRQAPVRVHEVLDSAHPAHAPEHGEAFRRGLKMCYGGDWAGALESFETLQEDPVARKYAERCRELLGNRQAVWDGVWNLSRK
jgi:adenylate cyclase